MFVSVDETQAWGYKEERTEASSREPTPEAEEGIALDGPTLPLCMGASLSEETARRGCEGELKTLTPSTCDAACQVGQQQASPVTCPLERTDRVGPVFVSVDETRAQGCKEERMEASSREPTPEVIHKFRVEQQLQSIFLILEIVF